MGAIFVGFIVVWGIVTGLTHGNWQAGLLVALIVMSMMISGHRAQRAAEVAAQRRLVIVEEEPETQPQSARRWKWL